MKYDVQISERAEADVAAVLDWFLAQKASDAGTVWLARVESAIKDLRFDPERFPLAEESSELGLNLHELFVGGRRGVHRVLFVVRERIVYVLRVWHSARDAIQAEDL